MQTFTLRHKYNTHVQETHLQYTVPLLNQNVLTWKDVLVSVLHIVELCYSSG